MARSKGKSHKSRSVFRKNVRDKGIRTMSVIFADYPINSKVDIIIDSGVNKGMPHRRYQGRTGTVLAKPGRAFEVQVFMGRKEKIIICLPEHLRLSKGVIPPSE